MEKKQYGSENKIELYAKSNISIYSSENRQEQQIEEKEITLTKQIGEFANMKMRIKNPEMEKGYLYANIIRTRK